MRQRGRSPKVNNLNDDYSDEKKEHIESKPRGRPPKDCTYERPSSRSSRGESIKDA